MGTSALDRADRRTYRDREVAACVEDRGVSSRRETTTSTLRRLGADAETVVSDLATGRAALPRLAMGSDDEGVVHVGIDREGDVVRLDLDAHWRDALPPARLGAAVTDALARAAEIRTGDWASALPRPDAASPVPPTPPAAGPLVVPADGDTSWPVAVAPGPAACVVRIAPGWAADADGDAVRDAVLAAVRTAVVGPAPVATAGLGDVVALQGVVHDALAAATAALPPFMRPSVLAAVDRVHDATTTALALLVSSQAVAGPALRDHASALRRCLHLVDRPAGLPEAAAAWAEAGVALTEGLARARSRPPVLGRLGRRLLRAAG